MGIIYDSMRKSEDEELVWRTEDDDKFISFHLFIELLELYADDSQQMIIGYLINNNEFLKLDFYCSDYKTVDENGMEIDFCNINEDASEYFAKPLNHVPIYVHHSYDDYSDDAPSLYPTKEYLERLLEDDIDDSFDDKCWKIEDILALDCMKRIGLDEHSYRECEKALIIDARSTLSFIRERKQFKEKLEIEDTKNTGSFLMGNPTVAYGEPKTNEQLLQELTAANAKIADLENQLVQANAALADKPSDDNAEQDHLYNWQAMDKNQYPPELHLAIEIWKEYYRADVVEHITQFDSSRFNRISTKLNLSKGNLKDRIRTLLTPLNSKTKSPELSSSLEAINIIYNDKLEQD